MTELRWVKGKGDPKWFWDYKLQICTNAYSAGCPEPRWEDVPCVEMPKPEEKRKKLVELLEETTDGCPNREAIKEQAAEIMADLEKRIDYYIGYQEGTEIPYTAKVSLMEFIRKEWLGEGGAE